MTTIDRAAREDYEAIVRLLEAQHLPIDGLRDHLGTTLVAREDGAIVGCAGLEVYREGALLRSVVVAPTRQGTGVGRSLIDAASELAQTLHVSALYLLTTTAERYFPRFGFERIARAGVPASVQASVEFVSACPASAVAMRKRLPSA